MIELQPQKPLLVRLSCVIADGRGRGGRRQGQEERRRSEEETGRDKGRQESEGRKHLTSVDHQCVYIWALGYLAYETTSEEVSTSLDAGGRLQLQKLHPRFIVLR